MKNESFPINSLIEELNKTSFCFDDKTQLVMKWEKVYINEKAGISLRIKNDFFTADLEINDLHIIGISIDRLPDDYRESFLLQLGVVLEKIGFDAFFIRKDKTILPATKKAEMIYSFLEPILPYLNTYLGSNQVDIRFPYLLREVELVFDFQQSSIAFYYGEEKLEMVTSKEEANMFYSKWLKNAEMFDEMFDDIFSKCLLYDRAAFQFDDKKGHIHLFSNVLSIGCSYFVLGDMRLYFANCSSGHIKEQLEEKFEDVTKLKESIFTFVEKVIKKSKIKATLQNRVHNYSMKVFYQMLGYYDNCQNVFCSFEQVEKAKNYINTHHETYKLEKLNNIDMLLLQRRCVNNSYILPNNYMFEESIDKVFAFGEYVFILGDKGYDPMIWMITKEEFKKLMTV